jgi:hypothetical protein
MQKNDATRYLRLGTTGSANGAKINYPAPYPNISAMPRNSGFNTKTVNDKTYAYPKN